MLELFEIQKDTIYALQSTVALMFQTNDKLLKANNDLMALVAKLQEQVNSLKDKEVLLSALHEAGVDNWSGYGDALSIAREARLE